MHDDYPLSIPKNPAQIPPSQFRLSRSLKVRGDAIYIIFSGIVGTVILFVALLDVSAILAIAVSWLPLAGSVWFYFKFVREKPKFYFDYCINGLSGQGLRINSRKVFKLKASSK